MKRKLLISLGLAVGLVAIVVLALQFGMMSGERHAQSQAPASDLLKPTNAEQVRAAIKVLNSPLTLINFWASWCEPCKKEFPGILAVREKLRAKGFHVVFVSIDEPADFKAAEEFLREHKVDFQTYYKGYERIDMVNAIYPKWEGAVPASVLVDANLQIVDAWEGDTTSEEFEQRVLAHMKGT